MFLNGLLVASQAHATSIQNNSGKLQIGWGEGPGYNTLNGKIDEVRISSNVRYSADFVPTVNWVNDGATAALYHFNEGTGNTTTDASSNGNNGTIYGATWSTDVPPNQFTEQTAITLYGVNNSSVAWGDYDNDGDLDILLTGGSSLGDVSKIYQNNGNNSFVEQTSISLAGVGHSSAAWGDYDNDGDLDIVLSGWTGTNYTTKIYRNNGNNTFTEQTSIALIGVENSSVAWGDYDNDGDLDLMVTGNTTSMVGLSKIYRNNGNNTFTEQTSISLSNVYWSSSSWADYDNDGDLDILLTGAVTGSSPISKIYRNNGNNTFTEMSSITLTGVGGSAAAWGDYNNDGNIDILLTGQSSSGYVSKIYRNNGDNTFTHLSAVSLTGIRGGSVGWGDYDNDGDLDILLTGQTSSGFVSKIYRNNGDNTFTEQSSIQLSQLYAGSAAWGDYDNDGDLDILLTGYNGSIAVSKIYRNNTSTANNLPTAPTNLSSTIIGQDVTFNWNKSTDNETPQNGLKYNLVIGTTPNGINKLSPMSNRSTGYRRVINLGNTNHKNSWTIKGLPNGIYYWSVQAVDNNFAGSTFAPEQSFSIGPPMISWLDTLKIVDNGNENGKLVYGQSYFATDSIDLLLGESSLPPTPPAGVFDVRFELPTNPNDYSLTDFRDDTLKAREWLIKFQPGSGGYPITFTWKPSELPKGLFFLKDIVTGSIVNVNMKDNNSFTLTNTGITALKIEYAIVPVTWDATILLKDNGNILQNLKFGQSSIATDGIDNALGELPLPPPPPTGSFDARFEFPVVPTDYSYLDYRSDTSKAITWLMRFQPGSEGYPFTFIWNPAELPEGFFYLKDNITGTIVNVNMKLTNSYSLTNTGITALKIEYSQQICFDVNLNQGWNIVSVPVAASDMNTQTLFPGFTSPTYTYNNGYQPVTTLANGLGYWIRYGSSSTINICGTQAGASTIPVYAGWNIIGGYGQDLPVAAITSTPPGILTSPFYGFNNGYVQPTNLQIGKGYWIRASQNGLINISTVLAKTNVNRLVSNAIDPLWNKIIVIDREGRQGVVYLAKGNIDLKIYDLPPTPPAGIFDVRYANDRNVEILNRTNEIIINSASYPITVRVEGIDIRIKDSFTGGIIDKVLRNGESILIEDNTIYKLTIGEVDVPSEYSLYQNYPNPFNPSTTIKFGLPENSNVVITIYNQLGEKIDVLLENDLEAGFHTITWNAASLASGLYFYEMKTNKFTSVKKLLLMK